MADKQQTDTRRQLIHCPNCGEDYSSIYRRCPFCADSNYIQEKDSPEVSQTKAARGSKRLARRKGGGYSSSSPVQIALIVVVLVVIVAACIIIATQLWGSFASGGEEDSTASPSASQDAEESQSPGEVTDDAESTDGAETTDTAETTDNAETTDDAEATDSAETTDDAETTDTADSSTATNFTLSVTDVTLTTRGQTWTPTVTFTPSGSTGEITWTSDDESIATVDENGTVTAVASGTTYITAMLANGATQDITVRCSLSDAAGYPINKSDFTLQRQGETFQLSATGYTGSVSWSSSNTGVATVSSSGLVTAVGTGKCTVTGTLEDGSTVQAIVRCNW